MGKVNSHLAILGLGVTIGAILVVILIFSINAKPVGVTIGGVEFLIPTDMPSQLINEYNTLGNTPSTHSFNSLLPITINGTAYSVPTSNSPVCAISEKTGYTSSGVEYDLIIPRGWVIVWDSWKAYWNDGAYENDGLLIIYGDWQGVVTVVNGEYCAVPIEWDDFAIDLRASGNVKPNRQHFIIGEKP